MQNITLTFLFFLLTILSFGQTSNYEKGINAFKGGDRLEAFNLLKPYAENGDAQAELIVGACYFSPELKIKNDSLSILYLSRSAEKLNTDAMKLLTMIYFEKASTSSQYKIESLSGPKLRELMMKRLISQQLDI